ncbi:MAG: hypothetical protein JST16_17010 [Bdellovibrionales bacterium]|nr:hypothetical protein [Bdellovibrionales bacterium]
MGSSASELVFANGDEFFASLCASIAEARVSIDLETYIFDRDELGDKVLLELTAAARRGVQVRLLLDGFGASNWSHDDAEAYRQRGVRVRFFHPLPWQRKNFHFWKYLTLRRIRMGLHKLNRRNHRKTCLVDGRVVFVGSMNVSARHLPSVHGNEAWRDTSVRVESDALGALSSAFAVAWENSDNYSVRQRLQKTLKAPFLKLHINSTAAESIQYRRELIECLGQTRRRIWITNPYFVPDRQLFRELLRAVDRGVDLRLLFPHKTDSFPSQIVGRSFYGKLQKHGAKIYEYQPSMLHAKVLIYDDRAMVGSSNLNRRSFFQDLEADLILSDARNVDLLSSQFENDLKVSSPIDAKRWGRRGLWMRTLELFFLMFRPLL